MSATLQIIAVMKTLGAITLKDHSIASVNQGTMEMDTFNFLKTVIRQSFFLEFGRRRKHRDIRRACWQAKYVYYMK